MRVNLLKNCLEVNYVDAHNKLHVLTVVITIESRVRRAFERERDERVAR